MALSTATPPKIFLDSSVFFAAAYSTTGAAHDLLLTAITGRAFLVLSDYVLNETQRNILASAPHVHAAFLRLCSVLPYQLSNPSEALVVDTARVVVAKDAPIIAAARASGATVVATYDRRHLLSEAESIKDLFGITVEMPATILKRIG